MSITRLHLSPAAARAYAAELIKQADFVDAANKDRNSTNSYTWVHADDSHGDRFAFRVSADIDGDDQFSL